MTGSIEYVDPIHEFILRAGFLSMLLEILTQIVLPVFFLIGVGVLVNRFMPADLSTLNRLAFHVFAPALVFLKLVDTDLDVGQLGIVAGFCLLHLIVLLFASWTVFTMPRFREQRPALVMGTIFYNAGNYGVPFAQLAFGDAGVRVMAIILSVQIVTNFTIGLWLVGASNGDWKAILRTFMKVPLIYAVMLALVMNALHLKTPDGLLLPLNYLANGLVPAALLTLGIQLARSRITGNLSGLAAIVFTRLFLSPLVAAGMAVLGTLLLPDLFRGSLAPILVVGLGLPVAVNAYILCAEYGQDAELASQSIFWTTLLSAFTLTGWLAMVQR